MINSEAFMAMMIVFLLIDIVLIVFYIKNIGNRNIMSTIIMIISGIALIVIIVVGLYSKKQGIDNIKEAINDNYNNAENILVQFDRNTKNNKGYFTSDDGNFSFEVINNTLVIKDGETIVKYISGNNY